MTKAQGEFVRFMGKVGIVCGGLAAFGIIISWTWGVATQPIANALEAERTARASADSLILREIRRSRHERFDLLDYLGSTDQRQREAKLAAMRARWAIEYP